MGIKIKCELLSNNSFQPYGSIVSPDEEVEKLDKESCNANQGTAIKLSQVSDITRYGNIKPETTPNLNLFRCFPRPHLKRSFLEDKLDELQHTVHVLEKHPFSSQTFLPMGRAGNELAYLIVVALPKRGETDKDILNEPDFSTLRAFICKGNQAVTYGQGVWHAPMIVVGCQDYLDFGVIIYETLDKQKPELDCIEKLYNTAETEILIGYH